VSTNEGVSESDSSEHGERDRPMAVDPLRELRRFGAALPGWQQHLLVAILDHREATAEEVQVAYQLLQADHGLLEGTPATAELLVSAPIGPVVEDSRGLRLQSLGPLTDVNRIAPDQVLPFGVDGLTVIYGENASGKTGFARVLKTMCRPGAQRPVLPNVITQTAAVTPAATVRYRLGDTAHEVAWEVGAECPPALHSVSFFDADEAPIFADEERRLEFLPSGLHALGALGETMVQFAERLDSEATQIRNGLPPVDVAGGTSVGRMASRLAEGQALPTDVELSSAGGWTTEDDEILQANLARLRIDPAKAAARESKLASSVMNMAEIVTGLEDTLGDKEILEIEEARTLASQARSAAASVGEALSKDHSRLANVGSDPWRRMVQDASEYVRLTFGSPDLPPLDLAICPLCQQDLDGESHDRLAGFWAYVQGNAERQAVELERAVSSRVAAAIAVRVPRKEDVETMTSAIEPVLPAAIAILNLAGDAFDCARQRQGQLAGAEGVASDTTPWPLGVPQKLTEQAAALSSLAEAHLKLADEDARRVLQGEIDEFAARQSLSVQLAAARARLRGLERLRAIAIARRACDTGNVSRRNSELRTAFLTSDFERRLQNEFAALGIGNLKLKLTSRSQAGHSLVSVTLDTPWHLRNRDVLSEGELRALSLACFLAEAQRVPGRPPMVLDDPVSSLDHQRVQRVAQRLIAEARRGRQVIVFTHNLVFFHELWMQASETQVPTASHWMTQSMEYTGHVRSSEQPWEVQSVKTRIDELSRRLAAAKRLPDRATDEYRSAVNHFYTGLRETWERLVEEQLLANVVQRFRLGVETRSLRLVEVTDDDYARVYYAMTRASEFAGHDRAVARQLAAPDPDDLGEDLKDLRDYHADLRKRATDLDKKRKARHAPPAAQLELPA
jgi:hypothetical protein